ncbi:hypothetical protein LY76DRAFT_594039 [Colletotrichum caudatum]|nr:hypothetical protein LY76DRAFT_594039 [Colletotrichum caudatum]
MVSTTCCSLAFTLPTSAKAALRTGVIYQRGTVEAAAKVTHILGICSSIERKRHLSEVEGVTSTWFNGTVLNDQPILAEFVAVSSSRGKLCSAMLATAPA